MLRIDLRKLSPNEIENAFQIAYDENDWPTMWYAVEFACENLAKKQLVGIKMDSEKFEIRVGWAILEVMEKIKNKIRPEKLSSFCYWPVRRALWSRAAIQEDAEILDYNELTDKEIYNEFDC